METWRQQTLRIKMVNLESLHPCLQDTHSLLKSFLTVSFSTEKNGRKKNPLRTNESTLSLFDYIPKLFFCGEPLFLEWERIPSTLLANFSVFYFFWTKWFPSSTLRALRAFRLDRKTSNTASTYSLFYGPISSQKKQKKNSLDGISVGRQNKRK